MKKLAITIGLTLCCLLTGVYQVSAALVLTPYEQAWTLIEEGGEVRIWDEGLNTAIINDEITGNEEFGIFKLGDMNGSNEPNSYMSLLNGSIDSGTLTFAFVSGNWTATYTYQEGENTLTKDLGLGSSLVWGFYFGGNLGISTAFYHEYNLEGPTETGYKLFKEAMLAGVQGATPVPVPTAFILLGTGLIGLLGLRRKRSLT
ncbi:MAG: PEP-CTERM sorting domain-containing protein [Desulfobacter sp.]|nr:MAG: PEP-CTERM sorting domain-containing protein [Desulfobacter sp.]